MAYTIGINKNMGQMFADLETLMLQEGWEKLSRNTIGSFTTSRGYKYTAGGNPESYPGRYSDTTAIKLHPNSSFTHSSVAQAASETFYNDYPKEFSISFWINLSECRSAQMGGGVGRLVLKFMTQFITDAVKRTSPCLVLDKDCAVGEEQYPMHALLYFMKYFFTHKDGKGWEFFTLVYSNVNKTVSLYINERLAYTQGYARNLSTYTYYGAIYQIYGAGQTKIIDELIVWNKCLSVEEISSIFNSPTSIPSTAPFVFEKYTENIGVLYGGVYKTTTSQGTPLYTSILYNTSNNIEFRTPIFYATPNFSSDYAVVNSVGQEGSPRCMAGVSARSTELKKYWLVVNQDRVVIAYKIHNPAAARTTPLYQLGYVGKIKSLGNDGNNIFSAGTTGTTANYLWTTINTTTFRSGVMYSSNNAHRIGGGYYNAVVGSINTTLSSLYSINNASFLAGINVSYSTTALGSLDGVFAVSHNQANAEDLITINATDYVILPDADGGAGVYNLALKLS